MEEKNFFVEEDERFFGDDDECLFEEEVPSGFEQFVEVLREEEQNFSIEETELDDWHRIRWYPFKDVDKAVLLYFDGDGDFREVQNRN